MRPTSSIVVWTLPDASFLPHSVPLACIIVVGYAILLSPVTSLAVRLVGILFAAMGIWCIVGLNVRLLLPWLSPHPREDADDRPVFPPYRSP